MQSKAFREPLVSAETGGMGIGIKADTLRRWARDGYIPSYKVRGALRFRVSDLKKLIVPRPAKQNRE